MGQLSCVGWTHCGHHRRAAALHCAHRADAPTARASASGPLGTARDRSGPLGTPGTARDHPRPIATVRNRLKPLTATGNGQQLL